MTNLTLTIAALVSVLPQVESGGNWTTPANSHHAEGGMQVKPIWIADMNRILREDGCKFVVTVKTTHCPATMQWLAEWWLQHYAAAWERRTDRMSDMHDLACFWRFGYAAYCDRRLPWTPKEDAEYGAKVEKALEKQNKADR